MGKSWQKIPLYQGRLDGLCGAYSILNAVNYLYNDFSRTDCEKLFAFMVKSHPELITQAIVGGMRFKHVWKLANDVQGYLAPKRNLKMYRPFYNNQKVASADEFLDRVSEMMGTRAVVLLGLGHPINHWSVATKISPKSIRLQDGVMKRVNRSQLSLDQGERLIQLDYHQSIVIERL